jgi:excinuclease ABC subunit A
VALRILALRGKRVSIASPLPGKSAAPRRLRERSDGYTRLLGRGPGRRTRRTSAKFARRRDEWLVLVDRLALRGEADAADSSRRWRRVRARDGEVIVVVERRARALRGLACDGCGRRFRRPAALRSTRRSASRRCQVSAAMRSTSRAIPDPSRSLEGGAPFTTPMGRALQDRLPRASAASREAALERTLQQRLVVAGDSQRRRLVRRARLLRVPEKKRHKVQACVLIARYRRFDPCPSCNGMRLRSDALAVLWPATRRRRA